MDSNVHTVAGRYSFEELSDPAASNAITGVLQTQPGPWWDHHDTDRLVEAIHQSLAGELGHLGGGFTDLPGIDVTCWDVDSGRCITILGVVDCTTAPALPWNGGPARSLTLSGPPFTVHTDPPLTRPDQLGDAALSAMAAAWQAGHADRATRVRRNVLDWIAGARPWFAADGTLFTSRASNPTDTAAPAPAG